MSRNRITWDDHEKQLIYARAIELWKINQDAPIHRLVTYAMKDVLPDHRWRPLPHRQAVPADLYSMIDQTIKNDGQPSKAVSMRVKAAAFDAIVKRAMELEPRLELRDEPTGAKEICAMLSVLSHDKEMLDWLDKNHYHAGWEDDFQRKQFDGSGKERWCFYTPQAGSVRTKIMFVLTKEKEQA